MKKIILGITMVASLFIACDNEKIEAETLEATNVVTGNNAVVKTVETTYTSIGGLVGTADPLNYQRRDNSDIIRISGTYYVWYSKIIRNVESTIWYATSPNGYDWTEQGMAIDMGGPGEWDSAYAYTPGLYRDAATNTYYLYWTGQNLDDGEESSRPTRIGVATANNPNGPWTKSPNNPILVPSANGVWDDFRIDDSSLVKRNGQVFLYYKGRRQSVSPSRTSLGVAVASSPAGPFTKYVNNPVINAGHEALVWGNGTGISAHIGSLGNDTSLRNANYWSADGYDFVKTANFLNNEVPSAPGAFRPGSFNNTGGQMPAWGLSMGGPNNNNRFLERFDWEIID